MIQNLIQDPARFADAGKSAALLDEYFDGLPVKTLRPLLRSEDPIVQREAAFIVSELGSDAWSVLDDIVPLLSSDDARTVAFALEAVMSCGPAGFREVLACLERSEPAIRRSAMYELARISQDALTAARDAVSGDADVLRRELFRVLLDPEEARVAALLCSGDPLERRYGAIAAKRVAATHPRLWALAKQSADPDLVTFTADPAPSHVHLDQLPESAIEALRVTLEAHMLPGDRVPIGNDLLALRAYVVMPGEIYRVLVELGGERVLWARIELQPLNVIIEDLEPDDD